MLWILFIGAALQQCFRILVLVPASEMASNDARMVDDAVEPAFAGSPESIPAVIMEIVHNIRVHHYEYVNHACRQFQSEIWLIEVGSVVNPWRTVYFNSRSMRTNITTETTCHGCWAPLTDVSESRLLGLRLSFDYLGRFAYVHYYKKQCELRRGEPDSPHRQKGYDYSGVDYMNRSIWVKLLHSFTLMHAGNQGVKRPRSLADREAQPPPPLPGLQPAGTQGGGTSTPSTID